MVKHINTKNLYKHVESKNRLYPQKEYWFKAVSVLWAGYHKYKNTKNILPPKPIPNSNAHLSVKKFVLKGHIAYAKNLNDQDFLDTFGFYLKGLKDSQWVRFGVQPDGTRIKQKKKKKVIDAAEELLSKPKVLKRARQELYKMRLLKKNKMK